MAMLNEKMSRRSFMTVTAMTAMALALDWKKITAHAARMGNKLDYPVVVIGAGLGGLCCGAYLARQGIPVTVIEQHTIPGGYATAFDRAGGKYTFEVSLHGTSSLMLLFLCGYEPWRRFETDYRAGRKADYQKEKGRWADILIRRAEQEVVPELSSMIEVKEAATPLTNWRFTGNTEGAIYGFEQSTDNAFMNRLDNRTPVKGLYLASAWGNPGGGFAGALRAGERTFEQIMADWA
jgi:phytoene dehydrogenase-like protein